VIFVTPRVGTDLAGQVLIKSYCWHKSTLNWRHCK